MLEDSPARGHDLLADPVCGNDGDLENLLCHENSIGFLQVRIERVESIRRSHQSLRLRRSFDTGYRLHLFTLIREARMDVRQLKFFLAVVDYGGFSKAADQLIVAQPSLSQAIATFERELGAPLFHRVGRGVVLSDAGKALVGPARVVLRDIDEAEATMRALKGLRGGRIDLVTMPSPGMEPLTTILTAFTRHHPEVTHQRRGRLHPRRGSRQCAQRSL